MDECSAFYREPLRLKEIRALHQMFQKFLSGKSSPSTGTKNKEGQPRDGRNEKQAYTSRIFLTITYESQ